MKFDLLLSFQAYRVSILKYDLFLQNLSWRMHKEIAASHGGWLDRDTNPEFIVPEADSLTTLHLISHDI